MRKLLLLSVILLLALQPISAQELLQLDELTSGELTTSAPTASYFVALKTGQALHLQVVGAATGLIPQATLNTATGALVQSIPNLDSSPNLEADLTATADGIFRLDISSLNGSTGKFVLLLQAITPPEPDATLSLDEPTSDTLNPNATVVYALNGNPASRLILSVTTTDPQASLDAQLLNASGAVVASFETQANGSQLIIPAQSTSYQLKLNNPQPTAVDYEITLMALDGLISTPVPPTSAPPTSAATPLPTESTACTVTPLNIAVNVRRGPSTRFAAFMSLQPGATMTAVARNPEGDWYQVQATNLSLGWVAASVITATGPCSSLMPVYVATPTLSPATYTPIPTTNAVAQRCAPYTWYEEQDNGAYMTIALPAADENTVISYRDGYHTQYVFPTCRAILWTSMTFTCLSYGGTPQWVIGQYARFDWNATCGSNTNTNQSGLSFGVK